MSPPPPPPNPSIARQAPYSVWTEIMMRFKRMHSLAYIAMIFQQGGGGGGA